MIYKKDNLINLKSSVDKLDATTLHVVYTELNSLKSDVDKIDFDKLRTVPTDLKKTCNIVKNEIVKKTLYNTLVLKFTSFLL